LDGDGDGDERTEAKWRAVAGADAG
jgi:hypothetical protein